VIGLDFGMFFYLKTTTPPEVRAHQFGKSGGSWSPGSEKARPGIEVSDLHDQGVVRITRTDEPGIGLRVFGCQNDDAHAAVAMRYRPLEMDYPLLAYPLRLPFERREKMGLVGKATA
jgi:hypothetical protein